MGSAGSGVGAPPAITDEQRRFWSFRPLTPGALPKGEAQNWGAGFLPSVYQGTWLRPKGDPIANLHRPPHGCGG